MRRNRTVPIIPIITVAAAVTVAGSACSASGTAGSGSAQGGNAASSGGSGGSPQAITLLAKMTAPQAVEATSKAVSAKSSVKVHMTMSSPVISETADGALSFGTSPGADFTLQMSSPNTQVEALYSQMGKVEMRMLGLVAYANMGGSQQMVNVLQGKRWMKIDFGNLNGVPALSNFSFMKDMDKSFDPTTRLKSLLAAPDLKKLGQEQRDGVQALHYAGNLKAVDLLKVSTASGLTQQDVDSLKATEQKVGITNATYDVWVDGSGLPVEIKFSETTSAGSASGDITYSDWGTPVSVSAPAADQTVDIAQLLKSQ